MPVAELPDAEYPFAFTTQRLHFHYGCGSMTRKSPLLERETLDSLPQDMEPVFYNAAQTYLIPKLRTLGGYGKYALTLPEGSEPDGHWQWLPLEWKAL